jgi:flagellar protein FlgJ
MAIAPLQNTFYADPTALSALKRDAASPSPDAVRETARQFEGLFTSLLLKSMRSASPGETLFGSDQQEFYQDMFDQQLATQLSRGKGLGLADMLVRQLMQGVPGAAQKTTMEWPPKSRDDFVRGILPAAQDAGRKLGVDPTVIVAHAALETGWGRSVPTDAAGRPSFNLFGIKAGSGWSGAAVQAGTHEFEQGRMQSVQAGFRAYESPEHSINDYAEFLRSHPRYSAALGLSLIHI